MQADPPSSPISDDGHVVYRRGFPVKRVALLIIASLALTAGVVVALSQRQVQHVGAGPSRVRVAQVTRDQGTRVFRLSGITRAAKRADLSFTIAGRLEARPVDIGDRVEEGTVLAQLDDKPLRNAVQAARAQVRQVQAQLGNARRQRSRARTLSEAQVASTAQVEAASSSVHSLAAGRLGAAAQLEEALRMLDEGTLRAPFPGVVSEVLLEAGEFAKPGEPVIVLSGDEGVEIEVEVPESEIHLIRVDSKARIDLPLAGREGLVGTVRIVGKAASRAGRIFPVVVRVDEGQGVVPGMAAEVILETERPPALSVPVTAVINPGGQRPSVYRVNDGVIQKVPVDVKELLRERVTVEGALEEGDLVVVGGHAGLVHGDEVTPVTDVSSRPKTADERTLQVEP